MMDKIQETNSVSKNNGSTAMASTVKVSNVQRFQKPNQDKQVSPQKAFNELARKLEAFKKVVKTSFKYEILKNPNMIVLKIVNDDNGEVVRQIPPKEAVKLAKAIDELLGLFVDKHV